MQLTGSIDIPRPAADVFEFVADPTNNPKWQKGMRSCEWITGGETAVGSQYRQEASFLGRAVISVFEVTAFEPGRSMSFATIKSTFPIQVTRTVESRGEGSCHVNAVIGGGPRVPKFLEGLLGRMAQRSVTRDYARLADMLS